MTEIPDELLRTPAPSLLRRVYRWLAFTGAIVIIVSMNLAYAGVIIVPFGALAAFGGLLVGIRWLDREPQLRVVHAREFPLALAAAGTFGALRALLQVPDLYWVYWAGLGLLLLNAISFVRHRARGIWTCGAVVLVFFGAIVLSVRSSAIVRAVETGSSGHARLFLWFGADANLRKQHYPLLVIAIHARDLTTARLLLDHGADPNAQTGEFMARTPALSEAAAMGRTDLVELLLDRGAAPDLCNNWGETALGRAARAGQAPAARLLLNRGANPNHTDDYGRRPIDAAREAHHSDVERILSQ